jgi:HlyD family secretion protein
MRDEAQADYNRALALQEENPDFISATEIDNYKYGARAQQAQLKVAEAAVEQARAGLENAETNLDYTTITSPVNGIVIDRKVDEGQTVAAQFQTPDLFVVAPNLEKEVYVYASINETDIGLIQQAKKNKQPVYFTVDAYPDDLFEGTIYQVRMNSTTTQNVVTYPVVVSAPNPELKLLPGMTGKLSFHVDQRENVLKIPNSALRFYPDRKQVRPEDHKLFDSWDEGADEDNQSAAESIPAKTRISTRSDRDRRHVWIKEGQWLRAVEVHTGMSDYKYTELVSGDLKEGQSLVTGVK